MRLTSPRAALVAAACAAPLLAGCVVPGPGLRAHAATALTTDQARSALLTVDDLSSKFEVDLSEPEGGGDWGCLIPEVQDGSGTEAPVDGDAEVSFNATEGLGVPGVNNSVTSGTTGVSGAKAALDELAAAYDGCTRVDTTGESGRWRLAVTTDTSRWAADADQQVNVAASGTVTLEAIEVPIDIRMSFVRIGAASALVSFFDMTDAHTRAESAHHDLVDVASSRLAAVLAGEQPPRPTPQLEDYELSSPLEDLLEDGAPDGSGPVEV